MVPAHFVPLAALPLTPNGKVDRKALPAAGPRSVTAGRAHVAPRTPTESRIAAIWADVLGIASPGVDDDFFDLGGHSLKAAQIVSGAALDLRRRRGDAAPVRTADDRRTGRDRGRPRRHSPGRS